MVEVVGIDRSGARDAGRRAWICRADGADGEFPVAAVHRAADKGGRGVEDLLTYVDTAVVRSPGARRIGIDFPFPSPSPFSVTRGVTEHLGHGTWRALVSSWEMRFPDAVAFAEQCKATSIAVSDTKETKRRTDLDARSPVSPWNLRLFRQTYHGVRLLRRLVASKRVAILPWDRPGDGEGRVAGPRRTPGVSGLGVGLSP